MTRNRWRKPESVWSGPECPFCHHDPYHYVHNGIGYEAVAVDCCELGIEFHTQTGDKRVKRIGYLLGGDKRRDRRGQRLLVSLYRKIEQEWADEA